MKILHVLNIPFVIPYFLGEQLLYFKSKGYEEFIVCSPSDELSKFASIYQFRYLSVEILRKISILKDIKAIFAVRRYIKENDIDVVTGHTPKGALIAMLAAYICRVPKRIYFRHGLVYETSTGLKRKLLVAIDRIAAKLSTQVVCVSPSVCKRSLEDKLNSEKKQTLLSKGTCNGIDVSRFDINAISLEKRAETQVKFCIKPEDLVIGYVGRLVKDKGIIELVQAFKALKLKFNNIKLLLVGMLEERDALPSDIVKQINEDSSIITTGYVLNSEIESYYAIMNIFVLASYREGFPTSVLEASSMQLPVITTRVTGCIDSIVENETGLFVNNDFEDLTVALDKLCNNLELRKSLGKNGRKVVVENFRQEIIWAEIEKLYK